MSCKSYQRIIVVEWCNSLLWLWIYDSGLLQVSSHKSLNNRPSTTIIIVNPTSLTNWRQWIWMKQFWLWGQEAISQKSNGRNKMENNHTEELLEWLIKVGLYMLYSETMMDKCKIQNEFALKICEKVTGGPVPQWASSYVESLMNNMAKPWEVIAFLVI